MLSLLELLTFLIFYLIYGINHKDLRLFSVNYPLIILFIKFRYCIYDSSFIRYCMNSVQICIYLDRCLIYMYYLAVFDL